MCCTIYVWRKKDHNDVYCVCTIIMQHESGQRKKELYSYHLLPDLNIYNISSTFKKIIWGSVKIMVNR